MSNEHISNVLITGAAKEKQSAVAMKIIAELEQAQTEDKKLRLFYMTSRYRKTFDGSAEPDRNLYSLGNPVLYPIHLNPCKIPYGVWPQRWIDRLIDAYCRAYGLLERGRQMLSDTVYAVYENAGVFSACEKDDWKKTVPELSAKVTFKNIYKHMESIKVSLEDPKNPKVRAGNDMRDAYARLLDRLQAFNHEYSIESKLFASEDGIGIAELFCEMGITFLDSSGLESSFSNFIFGFITSGFYEYVKAQKDGSLDHGQYKATLIIEDADRILWNNTFWTNIPSEMEEIFEMSEVYGLRVIALTNETANIPSPIAKKSISFADL